MHLYLSSPSAGNPYWRGRLSTVDLHVLTSLNQLIFKLKILFTLFTKLNEEVNCTESSPQLVFPAIRFKTVILISMKIKKTYLLVIIWRLHHQRVLECQGILSFQWMSVGLGSSHWVIGCKTTVHVGLKLKFFILYFYIFERKNNAFEFV